MEIRTFDTTTPTGWKQAIEFEKQNPQYKLITSRLDFVWYYEKKEHNV
tara:strand:+ start:79 stop:222 length:144 start_codon:yes stop_codon:yes gene_type:complete